MMAPQKFWSVFDNVYSALSGIHRIQRVSATEKSNRRHSSTITVSIMEDFDNKQKIYINNNDVRVDTFRSSGAGGQHRNKTDSGVRLTHLSSGIVVTATEERSQHHNRKVAWKRLENKLLEADSDSQHDSINEQRQVNDAEVSFVWTQWRDQVKGPNKKKTTMKKALNGKLEDLLK